MSASSRKPRLRRVTIRDFRGIDHLEIELPPDDGDRAGALVLAGDNGVGKTSVMEAILILFGRVDLLPADTASPTELVRQGAEKFVLEAEVDWGDGPKTRVMDTDVLIALDEALSVPGASSFGRAVDRAARDRALWAMGYGEWTLPGELAIESFSSRREPEDLGVAGSDARGRRALREERRLAELARRLANVFGQSGVRDTVIARVEAFLRTFLGARWSLDRIYRSDELGSDPVVVVRDGPLPSASLSLEGLRARAARGEAMPRVIPIDRLSSGQMAMLAMTYPFVFGDRVPDLVLIDEPEQHLHVSWQRAFLGALRTLSPTTQFVVATHSPWVLDSVPSYERKELLADDEPSPHAREAAE